MSESTDLIHDRLEPTARVAAWLLVGFVGVVALGFLRHAFWLSAAVGVVLMALWLPLVGRWMRARFASSVAAVVTRGLVLLAGMALLIGVSEYERAQRRAAYNENRADIIARAQDALEQGEEAPRVKAFVTRYAFVETPQLDRFETALAQRREQEASNDDDSDEKSRKQKKIDEMVDQVMEQYRQEHQ